MDEAVVQAGALSSDGRIASADRGFVKITPDTTNSIAAQSMFYFRDAAGSVDAMYGVRSREALGSQYNGSYNLFLGMQNYLTVSNITSANLTATISTQSTTENGSGTLTIGAYATASLPVHDTTQFVTSPDTYGLVQVLPTAQRSFIVDLLRLRPSGSETDFVFPTEVGAQ